MLLAFIAVLFSLALHEYAHGLVAYKRGDYTLKASGRLSMNPLKHIDPIGSVIVPLLFFLLRLPALGWAKPIPVNPYHLRNPRKDMFWIALAGPLSNLSLASGVSAVNRITPPGFANELLSYIGIVNILWGVINLLPVPPFDGWRILRGIMPYTWFRNIEGIEPYGLLIVGVLVLGGAVNRCILPCSGYIGGLLGFKQLF